MNITNLLDIEYLDGKINKKTVFDNENSSLTLLAYKKGVSRAPHIDPADEVAQIVEGEAKITIDGREFVLRAGEMIVMPQGSMHGLEAVTDVKMLLLRPKHTH